MASAATSKSMHAWQVIAALVIFLLLRYGRALTAPFFSDDYLFFDKVAGAPLHSVWSARDLAYQWYRPWSRELHYWTFYRLFGLSPIPYHVAGFALWLAAMGLYWRLVTSIAGRGVATLACCGVATLAAWGVLLEWSPGVQDLWMLVFALASLLAFTSGRIVWSTVALALALLSKENAAMIPAIAFAYSIAIERRRPTEALRRVLPLAALVFVWACVHPSLGGRLWWARESPALPSIRTSPLDATVRSLLALFNMDLAPKPISGWPRALAFAAPGAIVLAALAWLGLRGRTVPSEHPARSESAEGAPRGLSSIPDVRVIVFGALWMLAGLLPLLAPSVLWQPYYALYASLGAWLVLAVLLARRPVIAVAGLLAIGLFSGVRSDTPSRDWGNEVLQRYGKRFMAQTESYLKGRFPSMPGNARLYFTSVPRGVVFVTNPNDAPALRVWFRDPSVMGSFWSDYRPRGPKESAGPDYFFRYDSLRGWFEVIKGPESRDSTRTRDPEWKSAHERLAWILTQAGDLGAARVEYEKLADVYRTNPEYAFLAGMTYEAVGDSSGAGPWYRRAARLPGADPAMKARASRFGAPP
jgi:hypothetical protein